MEISIQHVPERLTFLAIVDGHTCVIEYALRGDVMQILHTKVPQAVAGRGIADEMTRYAVDSARKNGWKVDPVCSYTRVWLKRHPQYLDLLGETNSAL